MSKLPVYCIAAGLMVAASGSGYAGSGGLGLPDPGAGLRALSAQSVQRFKDSAAQVDRSQRRRQIQRNNRSKAFGAERRARQKRIDLERELSTQ